MRRYSWLHFWVLKTACVEVSVGFFGPISVGQVTVQAVFRPPVQSCCQMLHGSCCHRHSSKLYVIVLCHDVLLCSQLWQFVDSCGK